MQRIFVFILAHFSGNDKNRFLSAPAAHSDGTDGRLLTSVLFYTDNSSFHLSSQLRKQHCRDLPVPAEISLYVIFCYSAPLLREIFFRISRTANRRISPAGSARNGVCTIPAII